MMFRAPDFWHESDAKNRAVSDILWPLGAVWSFFSRKRFDLHVPVPMEKPVICAGNVVLGGAGKTPLALALCDILQDMGLNPHFLTRGYGGTEPGPLQVAPARDTAADVGDEALLLVERAPTWVAARRALGAQAAFDTGANAVILDDGFQNAALFKDVSILAVDGGYGFGNGRVFPAGPLREDLAFGLSRAQAVVVIGEDRAAAGDTIRRLAPALPLFEADLIPDSSNPPVAGRAVYAFAGIGRPEKFRETLERAGAKVEGWGAFPDHYAYRPEDLTDMVKEAEAKGALILTTAKDHVRLPEGLKEKISPFRVRLAWRGDAVTRLTSLIAGAISARR